MSKNHGIDDVSAVTIKNFFKRAGYITNIETEKEALMPEAISQEDWNHECKIVNISVSNYIEIDDDVTTTGTLTDNDIIESFRAK